mgnify:CR=1 FL=1
MPLLEELSILDKKAQEILKQSENIKKIAKKYASSQDMLFIGRGYNYPSAIEAALKLKEVSYIHAEGYAAGLAQAGTERARLATVLKSLEAAAGLRGPESTREEIASFSFSLNPAAIRKTVGSSRSKSINRSRESPRMTGATNKSNCSR